MNGSVVREISLVAVAVAAVTTVALGLSSRTATPGGTARPGPGEHAAISGPDPVRYGAKLYQQKSCVTCHSVDGSVRIGPTFLHDFGSQVTLEDGTIVLMDAA